MSARPNRSSQHPPPPAGTARQNDYFVPRDGIDREVITADICRYLGNDALVRPGTYESPEGRVTQGYFITAYRNLTSAMIQDLKADSLRWEQERRSTSRSTGSSAGAPSSRDPPRYHTSETHHNRQYFGPSGDAPAGGYGDSMNIDTYPSAPQTNTQPRYPGTGNNGYYGVNSSNAQDTPMYGTTTGYNTQAQPAYGYTQYPQTHTTDRFPVAPPGAPTQASAPYIDTGSHYSTAPATEYNQNSRMVPPPASSRNTGYGQSSGYSQDGYYGSTAPSNYAQPQDAFYGRGQGGGAYNMGNPSSTGNQASDDLVSPAGAATQPTGYSAPPEATPPYSGPSQPPSSSRTTAPSSSNADAQMTNSGSSMGASSSRRDPDRETRERSHRDRNDRERDREREDRHATERREHRHRHR